MTTYVHAPSCVSSHIHYINSDLRLHFLICEYGIFLFLRCAIIYPRNMSAYNLCIPPPFFLCLHALETCFLPFSFVSTLYPVLCPSISTLDLILSPPVSMLDSIYSCFGLTLTTYPTDMIYGGQLCSVPNILTIFFEVFPKFCPLCCIGRAVLCIHFCV